MSPSIYQALSLKKGLELWLKHHIRVNSAWTPRAMMRTAIRITGEDLKPRDYAGAIKALERWLLDAKAKERVNG